MGIGMEIGMGCVTGIGICCVMGLAMGIGFGTGIGCVMGTGKDVASGCGRVVCSRCVRKATTVPALVGAPSRTSVPVVRHGVRQASEPEVPPESASRSRRRRRWAFRHRGRRGHRHGWGRQAASPAPPNIAPHCLPAKHREPVANRPRTCCEAPGNSPADHETVRQLCTSTAKRRRQAGPRPLSSTMGQELPARPA